MENNPEKFTKAKLFVDFIHRISMHHALWFMEVQHQFGREAALEIMKTAYENGREAQMQRFARLFGFTVTDGVPSVISDMSDESLSGLVEAMAVNWLAVDGTWFQAVENYAGMTDAKRCNDSCWAQFSPFEAWSVKSILKLGNNAGLDGLKKALAMRLYAFVNKQEITDETTSSFVFRMTDCRVQAARRRKGMPDYPCKSAGMVEYREFAKAIDPRIKTSCIACPPDEEDRTYYCAWKFVIEN